MLFAAVCMKEQSVDSIPNYQLSQTDVSGMIRSWGDDKMQMLMKYWQEGFRKYHPDVKFEDKLKDTGTGMASIYTDVAEIGVIGRDASTEEAMGCEWVKNTSHSALKSSREASARWAKPLRS